MSRGAGQSSLFGAEKLEKYLNSNTLRIRARIEQESEDYILNVNETDFIEHVVQEFMEEEPQILFDEVFATTYHRSVSDLIRDFRSPEDAKPLQVIVYHLPVTGNIALLELRPSGFTPNQIQVEIYLKDNELRFELGSLDLKADDMEERAAAILGKVKSWVRPLQEEIVTYNNQLHSVVKELFRERKQWFLNKNNMLSALSIPIRKRENLPPTFAIVPPKAKKILLPKPQVTQTGFAPEPTIDNTAYVEILQTIFDLGKAMERLPATYQDRNEEQLRDHFLLILQLVFEGTATGETFNRQGKTDILLRHANSNVFIAECKFWKGKKQHLAAITQLLKYLTWRDSKAAVVVFVKTGGFSSNIEKMVQCTPNHPQCLGFVDKRDESWFNYRFCLQQDRNREVKLAVLLFHFP